MDEDAFDSNVLANVVKKMLQNFEGWISKTLTGKARYAHVDVTLSKEGAMFYRIQVTNYGQFDDDILHVSRMIFDDFVSANVFLENSSLATVYSRNEHSDFQSTRDLRSARRILSLTENVHDNSLIDFANRSKYLSFQLKHKLLSRDLEVFTKTILDEINLLQRLNSFTKFTYHRDQKLLYNNHIPLDNDYKSCKVLATALTDIVKHSLDVKFKERCFVMLKVENSHQAETALMTKLLPLIHANYIFPD